MAFIFALLLAIMPSQDIIPTSIENYNSVESYSVTLRSKSGDSNEEMRYYYKKPGFVRMEFIEPHKGAALVYNPLKKEAGLRPFGFFKSFVLTMSPDNSLIRSSEGHRVDESDIGALLKVVKKLQDGGKTEVSGEESIGNRPVVVVSVKGEKDFTVNGIHRYILWLDKKMFLPLKVAAYDMQGKLIEEVLMDDLRINIGLTEDFFDL
ncbi:MAG TPA: DUF1571 domain-containing protein [Nitrospiraceae bacterium]|nr:DUF1571 domain-containing protein [Nitrospiraceae bacterium]